VSEQFRVGSFEAGGIPFTVETNRHDFAARVRDVFRDLRIADGGLSPVVFGVVDHETAPPAHPWSVSRDGEEREMTVADSYVLTYLLWEVTRLLFEQTGHRVHLHGAALVKDGMVVVLAGRSHAGKSTLAAWLTYRGWGFLTDEAALVDPETLIVSPFWRPINVRRPGPLDPILKERKLHGPLDAEVLVPASALGALADAAPLASIAFPCFTPKEQVGLSPMSPAAALVELTQHFPGLVAGGRAGFRWLARLVEAVPAYELRFHDLDDAEQVLRAVARKV
jgi:hypothetical protein